MGYNETHQKPKNKLISQTKIVTLYSPLMESTLHTILALVPPSHISHPSLTTSFVVSTISTSESITSHIYYPPRKPLFSTINTQNDPIHYFATDSSNNPSETSYNGCGTNYYQNWIYEEESGCDPTKVNSIGCVGIGQDCNGVLYNLCPSLTYTCENQYFTSYMLERYGTWQNAYNFHVANGWW